VVPICPEVVLRWSFGDHRRAPVDATARVRGRHTIDRRRGDDGAVLVLALVLLIVGAFIVGGLTFALSNNLNNSAKFKTSRTLQYAANSAVNQAIQSIRYAPLLGTNQTLNASPPSNCWGATGSTSELTSIANYPAVAVWCSTLWTPTSAASRVVTIDACLLTIKGVAVTATACAAAPALQAVVTFDDYPPGLSAPTSVECDVYCGTGLTIDSWVLSPSIPTVSKIKATSGPVTGGTTITITGTGFVTGSQASFIEESGGVPSNDNVVLAGTNETVNSPTSMTVVTPSMTSGKKYFVTVQTPTGTSADVTTAVFTYTPVLATVTAISNTAGSTAGGSSITITGTGFVTGSVVDLFEESSGSEVTATSVAVNSDSSITAITPSVTAAGSYYVTVLTPAGTSAYTSSAIFTYSPLVPTVASISPTTGSHTGGKTITITGTGFVSGATVTFTLEILGVPGTTTLAGSNVVVVSPTSITATTPAATQGQTYYVTVTTASGQSSYYPIYTYS
jgi:hypothetical protein